MHLYFAMEEEENQKVEEEENQEVEEERIDLKVGINLNRFDTTLNLLKRFS